MRWRRSEVEKVRREKMQLRAMVQIRPESVRSPWGPWVHLALTDSATDHRDSKDECSFTEMVWLYDSMSCYLSLVTSTILLESPAIILLESIMKFWDYFRSLVLSSQAQRLLVLRYCEGTKKFSATSIESILPWPHVHPFSFLFTCSYHRVICNTLHHVHH